MKPQETARRFPRPAWWPKIVALVLVVPHCGSHGLAAEPEASVTRIIPADGLVFYVEFEGLSAHPDAWSATAIHGLMEKTPAGAMIHEITRQLLDQLFKADADLKLTGGEVIAACDHLVRHGFVVAEHVRENGVATDTVVVKGAGTKAARKLFDKYLLFGIGADGGAKLPAPVKVRGRDFFHEVPDDKPKLAPDPNEPVIQTKGAQAAAPPVPTEWWWYEGDDLVIVAGSDEEASDTPDPARDKVFSAAFERYRTAVLDTIEGKQANATTHPSYIAALAEGKDIKTFQPDGLFFIDPGAQSLLEDLLRGLLDSPEFMMGLAGATAGPSKPGALDSSSVVPLLPPPPSGDVTAPSPPALEPESQDEPPPQQADAPAAGSPCKSPTENLETGARLFNAAKNTEQLAQAARYLEAADQAGETLQPDTRFVLDCYLRELARAKSEIVKLAPVRPAVTSDEADAGSPTLTVPAGAPVGDAGPSGGLAPTPVPEPPPAAGGDAPPVPPPAAPSIFLRAPHRARKGQVPPPPSELPMNILAPASGSSTDVQAPSGTDGKPRPKFSGLPAAAADAQDAAELVKILGLDRIKRIVGRFGFDGRALLTDVRIEAPSPRTGALACFDQPGFRKDGLPPIPPGSSTFVVNSLDIAGVSKKLVETLKGFDASVGGAIGALEKEFKQVVGLGLREDLLAHLGVTWSVVRVPLPDANRRDQGVAGAIDYVLLAPIDNAEAFGKVLDTLAERTNEWIRESERGAEQQADGKKDAALPVLGLERLAAPDRGYRLTSPARVVLSLDGDFQPTILVGKSFVACAANLEIARAALAAESQPGKPWKPTGELVGAFASLPERLTFLAVGDDRDSLVPYVLAHLPAIVQRLGTFLAFDTGPDAPLATGILSLAGVPLPGSFRVRINPSGIPTAEQLQPYLFPSVFAATVDDRGIRFIAREAFPLACMGDGASFKAALKWDGKKGLAQDLKLNFNLFP